MFFLGCWPEGLIGNKASVPWVTQCEEMFDLLLLLFMDGLELAENGAKVGPGELVKNNDQSTSVSDNN